MALAPGRATAGGAKQPSTPAPEPRAAGATPPRSGAGRVPAPAGAVGAEPRPPEGQRTLRSEVSGSPLNGPDV